MHADVYADSLGRRLAFLSLSLSLAFSHQIL